MNCQYCGENMEDGAVVCPSCGKPVEEPKEVLEENAAEETTEPHTEEDSEKKSAEGKKRVVYGVIIAVLVVIIGLLIVKIVKTKAPVEEAPEQAAEVSETVSAEAGEQIEAAEEAVSQGNGISYSVTEDELTEDVMNTVIVSCGDETMTNRDLPLYFWQQYGNFVSVYSTYLQYLLDTTVGLDQQMYSETQTWQQYFLEQATNMYSHISAICQEAEKEGFTASEEIQETYEDSMENLEKSAESYGFESIDAYLKEVYGPTVTEEMYRDFAYRYSFAAAYLEYLVEQEGYTDDDISNYYDENAESYESQGIAKLDTPVMDIRHILITPEETDEEGNYTDEAWAAAEAEAQSVLDQWLAGEATEDSFAALAEAYSDDTGSVSNGGLYEDVYPGRMVTEFNSWCFLENHKPGDYGIVKTSYGYHVMFYSEVGEEIYWREVAKNGYLTARSNAIENDIVSRYTIEIHEELAALVDKFLQG